VASKKDRGTGEKARLIPVYGIGSKKEAERRAASALLAVLTVARDLSVELLSPLGASRAQKATVEAFTEVPFDLDGRKVRPDGLIRVIYGKTEWTTLVEVKTGDDTLTADQVNAYWDIAREHNFNHVITISNEIAPVAGSHPTEGLRFRPNSPVQVSHMSWTTILTSSTRIMNHRGVEDPEQGWVLSELIRYLQHPASGVVALEDMGPNWTSVRDEARASVLSKNTSGVAEIAARFDQTIRLAALKLSSEIGEDVEPVLSRAHREKPALRLAYLVDELCSNGTLDAKLRVPNTAGDIEFMVDLRSQQMTATIEVDAPEDKGAVGRVSWLLNQLEDVDEVILESYAKNARTPVTTTVGAAEEDRRAAVGDDKIEPYRFHLIRRTDMSTSRRPTSRQGGFIGGLLQLIEDFYEDVVQQITPWQPPAPKRKRSQAESPTEEEIVESMEDGTSFRAPPRRPNLWWSE
jgi:hypothetical protein